jgi:hypothetical protein
MTIRNSEGSAPLGDPPDDEMPFISATDFAIQAINTYKIASQKASVYARIDKAAVLIASTSRKEDISEGADILSKGTQTEPIRGATRCRCTDPTLSTQPCGCPERMDVNPEKVIPLCQCVEGIVLKSRRLVLGSRANTDTTTWAILS